MDINGRAVREPESHRFKQIQMQTDMQVAVEALTDQEQQSDAVRERGNRNPDMAVDDQLMMALRQTAAQQEHQRNYDDARPERWPGTRVDAEAVTL